MRSIKNSSTPLTFRVAAFYVFFLVFLGNVQPYVTSQNNAVGKFLNKVYSFFWAESRIPVGDEHRNAKVNMEDGTCGIDPVPMPQPPAPPRS